MRMPDYKEKLHKESYVEDKRESAEKYGENHGGSKAFQEQVELANRMINRKQYWA